MGCISNITGAITYDCLGGAVGIADLLLINYSDIQSISIANGIATITLTTSGKVIRVASIRKGANATEAQRINENAPNALEQSVNFTVYKKTSAENVFINTILNSRLVAVAKMVETGVYRIYGCNYGLEVSGLEESANDNGGYTAITLTTPENVLGEARASITEATWNTLVSKSS
ncbi:hypothetical protein SAMN02910431_04633 [Bacteroides sp. AR20]|jgi:hypothetical protein|uniref:hypothetical protein n=1 Tax=Bacteroides TaxID=816 RepID=UPI0008B4828F|nr:hypothetical protein [Bacteroides sp. AR20]SEO62171.1 hypothetical protein SAMN02910431_04633 [Bacteroides sp. AR20]